MKLKLTYKDGPPDTGLRNVTCEVTNAETGEPLERVVSVQFRIAADDALPRLIMEVIPSVVELEGEAEVVAARVVDPEPMPTVIESARIA